MRLKKDVLVVRLSDGDMSKIIKEHITRTHSGKKTAVIVYYDNKIFLVDLKNYGT